MSSTRAWGEKMNKQGPLKAILDKGGLRNISAVRVPTVFLKRYYYFKTSMEALHFSFIIITYHHRSNPLGRERPDPLKMWSNINFMLKSVW